MAPADEPAVRRPPIPVSGAAREQRRLRRETLDVVARVLASGRVVRGPAIAAFERAWARTLGVRHVVLVHSGTTALAAALAAVGVRRGDEVVVPAFTFVATAEAVLALGAVPVAVDVDPGTLLLDSDAALRAVGPRTRAVVPVHLFGQLHPGLPGLARRLRARRVALVEDACQAHGASSGGIRPGRFGAAAFSFYPTKNLGTCGEAGAVAANDGRLAAAVRALRDHGARAAVPGLNLWPGEVEAAVLRARLPRLRAENAARRALARRYDAALGGCAAVRPLRNDVGAGHAYHQYVVRAARRDELRALLAAAGIETAVHYPQALPDDPALRGRLRVRGNVRQARAAAREVVSLPVHGRLTETERRRCVAALRRAARALEG